MLENLGLKQPRSLHFLAYISYFAPKTTNTVLMRTIKYLIMKAQITSIIISDSHFQFYKI